MITQQATITSRETAGARASSPSYTDGLAQAICQIADVSRQSKLPTGEIPTFNGDPRSYQRFIQTFKFVVEANTITAHVRAIRAAFRAVDPAFDAIKTERGLGYRWVE